MSRIRQESAGMMLFAAIGMVVEVFVTGLPRMNFTANGMGFVSILMAILYASVFLVSPWLFALLDFMKLKNRFIRAFFTVFLIYAFEWSFGALCRACGFMPWNYTGIKPEWTTSFSDGNICLLFFPGWYIYALIVEPLIKSLRRMLAAIDKDHFLTAKGFFGLTANGQNR